MTAHAQTGQPFWRLPVVIIVCGCLIGMIGFGARSTMGFFLVPMTETYGWSREAFSTAIAVQNLIWGMAQPFVGMLADRYGTARVLSGGAVLYGLGMVAMAYTTNPLMLQFTAGGLLGFGIAGSAFFLVLAAFARLLPEHLRSLAFGLGTAAGSFGQFLYAPLGQAFIGAYGWQTTLILMGASAFLIPVLTLVLKGKPQAATGPGHVDQTVRQALAEAFGHGSYWWLIAGFFVCGFHVAFITVHLPPYINDLGLPPHIGGWAIGLIGLFNVIGAIGSGALSGAYSKRWVLSSIYFGRVIVITVFVLTPPSVASVLIFSGAMGILWLSTIPPTQGLVAVMFGTRYMAMLFGFVFFSHQVGSFLGIWLGGLLRDITGSYDIFWWISVALGVFSGLAHMPIREEAVPRPAPAS
ncbi:MFS transporter [Coralliovum pocilloporae]|uniref:MFS transporter n=1 Tax=Coralliovum pocilloporae TaxID=3066369 RepID=UPI0033072C9C